MKPIHLRDEMIMDPVMFQWWSCKYEKCTIYSLYLYNKQTTTLKWLTGLIVASFFKSPLCPGLKLKSGLMPNCLEDDDLDIFIYDPSSAGARPPSVPLMKEAAAAQTFLHLQPSRSFSSRRTMLQTVTFNDLMLSASWSLQQIHLYRNDCSPRWRMITIDINSKIIPFVSHLQE